MSERSPQEREVAQLREIGRTLSRQYDRLLVRCEVAEAKFTEQQARFTELRESWDRMVEKGRQAVLAMQTERNELHAELTEQREREQELLDENAACEGERTMWRLKVAEQREALELLPDPDAVPQWGVPDYREAIRKVRRALSQQEAGGEYVHCGCDYHGDHDGCDEKCPCEAGRE